MGSMDGLKITAVSLASQMPVYLVLILALIGWLRHERRGTRGMNLLGAGILVEFAVRTTSPFLSAVIMQLYMSTVPGGAPVDPYVLVLAQGLLFSLLQALSLGLILWGAFAIARERQEEETMAD